MIVHLAEMEAAMHREVSQEISRRANLPIPVDVGLGRILRERRQVISRQSPDPARAEIPTRCQVSGAGVDSSTMLPPDSPPADGRSRQRKPWADRWLLEAFQRLCHPALARLGEMVTPTAWEGLALAGVPDEQLLEMACALSGCPPAGLDDLGPAQSRLLDRALALRCGVVPIGLEDGQLEVATANPLRPGLEDDLRFAAGFRSRLTVASPAAISVAMDRVYGAPTVPDSPHDPTEAEAAGGRFAWVVPNSRIGAPEAPVRGAAVETLNEVLAGALEAGASDIHLEPKKRDLLVRYRVDGVLHDVTRIPGELAGHLISRLKVMAGLDIADRMRPQDGRASTVFDGRPVDLRISTLPLGNSGEKAVIRLLDSGTSSSDLGKLGFTQAERFRLDKLLTLSEGMILVTGPTGSGKTTTLYSAIRFVQSEGTNVVTVEDPIEYRLEGINQVQVHDRSGLTFAAALRSILRQDPDTVLVGEIRDAETSEIAIRASMTGHLVLSTLHTNDAASALIRLLDIGADAGALSGALKGVVAQRLVRKLCPVCSMPDTLEDLQDEFQYLLIDQDCSQLRKAVGCPECRQTGYKGRMVVPEILLVTPELQRAIARRAEVAELNELAIAGGMRSIWDAGLQRVVKGLTSLHELLDGVTAPLHLGNSAQSDVDALLSQVLPLPPSGGRSPIPVLLRDSPTVVSTLPSLPPSGYRILLVEEDRLVRRRLRAELESQGFSIIEVADGEAALAYARRLRPDAIVTELTLSKLDGIGLLQELWTDPDAPRTIVYTAQTDPALLEWAVDLGAIAALPSSSGVKAIVDLLRGRVRGAA
jgi:type II secretory ATPase GspE/PulE/Tfp pilus assembly ATPase PilB-like protein/CheY-like chemotaxis protein